MTHRDRSTGAATGVDTGPRYCERCGKAPVGGEDLTACPSCGDRMVVQGYCPVCEDRWRLPVGTACPKHDLLLEAAAPTETRRDATGEFVRWTSVGRHADSLAAEAARIRLEAEGIPTFIEGERMGSRSMYEVATGGVRLKVPDDLAAEARIILSQTWSATAAALDIEDDADDADEEWPPESTGRSFRTNLVFFLAIGLPSLVALCLLLRRASGH